MRALLSAATLALAGLASAATYEVHVYNYDFSLNLKGLPVVDAVINIGDTVRWTLQEGHHTVTTTPNQSESFDGQLVPDTPTFEHTFTHEGVFLYRCRPHSLLNADGTVTGMQGTITVEPVPEPATLATLGLGGLLLVRRKKRTR